MTQPPTTHHRLTVAHASPEPHEDAREQLPELPEALRRILRSVPKLALLAILEEGPHTTSQLRERVTGTITLAGLNMHLSELLADGYVQQIDVQPRPTRPGRIPRAWALNTDPGWRALAAAILTNAPTPPDS